MRISCVGKGGSGKSTLSALLVQEIRRQQRPVLAIDADINIHLPRLLGMAKPSPEMHLSSPESSTQLKQRLKGDNNRIHSMGAFRKTTPPAHGSHLLREPLLTNPDLKPWLAGDTTLGLIAVGTYEESDIGASCYHNHLANVEILLNHTLEHETVICIDMVAGTDAFASTMHLQSEITLLVVEPTWRGVELYHDYLRLFENANPPSTLYVIGNKIHSNEDLAFLQKHIPPSHLLTVLPHSSVLQHCDREWLPLELSKTETALQNAILSIWNHIKDQPSRRQERLHHLFQSHARYVSQPFIVERFGDLTQQIDTSFAYEE